MLYKYIVYVYCVCILYLYMYIYIMYVYYSAVSVILTSMFQPHCHYYVKTCC